MEKGQKIETYVIERGLSSGGLDLKQKTKKRCVSLSWNADGQMKETGQEQGTGTPRMTNACQAVCYCPPVTCRPSGRFVGVL